MRNRVLASAAALAFGALAAGSASAADLSVVSTAPLPGSAPIIGWTGFHVGVVGAYGWGNSDATLAGPNIFGNGVDISIQGALVGGTVGYDHEFGSGLVAGIEADVSAGKIGGTASTTTFPATLGAYNVTWLATVRGRIGWSTMAFGNPTLWYVTGGAAFAGTQRNIQNSFNTPAIATSATNTGWTIGAGVEHKIAQNWSVKAEYLYADLGTAQHVGGFGGGGATQLTNVKLTTSLFRVGLNHQF